MKTLIPHTMKAPLFIQMIQEYLSEYHIAVRVFIYLVLITIITCALALAILAPLQGAPEINIG